MRTDLLSMNSGKGMAQASHASNAFIHQVNKRFHPVDLQLQTNSLFNAVNEWETTTTQGFGTVLVLQSTMNDIKKTIDIFKSLDYLADVVHDPTYPILDGTVVHYLPLDTCGYVFVPNKETDITAQHLLSTYCLHR